MVSEKEASMQRELVLAKGSGLKVRIAVCGVFFAIIPNLSRRGNSKNQIFKFLLQISWGIWGLG